MLERGEVGGRVILADTAFVVAEDHIQHPMQAVLHGPVAANDGADQVCRQRQGGDVKAGLLLDFVPNFTRALDHDDALQPRPVVALLQPGDIVDHGIGSGFDAAVIAIDGLMAAHLGVLKAFGLLLGGEQFGILAQRALIAFERQNVIGFFVHDCFATSKRKSRISQPKR